MEEIKNLEARMKLIIKENEMLKQLVLKDLHPSGKDKENVQIQANYNK